MKERNAANCVTVTIFTRGESQDIEDCNQERKVSMMGEPDQKEADAGRKIVFSYGFVRDSDMESKDKVSKAGWRLLKEMVLNLTRVAIMQRFPSLKICQGR